MAVAERTAVGEWKSFGALPIVAALGYATSVIHIYGLSPYIQPLEEAFGWSRSQVTIGLTIATLINGILAIPVGMIVDRLGPRIVGIVGILLTCSAFAFMGTADGTMGNWQLLWGIIAIATLPVQATIWTSAVASRFEISRGLALAITLSGASLAQTVFPPLATWLINTSGWRSAFMIQAAIWGGLTIPALLFFFHGAKDIARKNKGDEKASEAPVLTGVSAREAMMSFSFVRLFIACLFFTLTIIALVYHFIPILMERGVDSLAAAGIASVIGISSLVGRLSTGFLLDRFRASYVGAIAFLLPILGCALLMYAPQSSVAQIIAAMVIGLTLGSEIDVVAFITTRLFGMKNFGAIYGGLLLAFSIGTAFGPLAAADLFDRTQSYTLFLYLTVGCMLISSLAIVTLPKASHAGAHVEEDVFPHREPPQGNA